MTETFNLRTAKLIRKKCQDDILALQKVCNHPDMLWVEECWAPGHLTGRRLKICTICEATLETKDSWIPFNEIT